VEERQGRPRAGRHLHQRGLHPEQGAAAVASTTSTPATHFADHGIGLKDLSIDVAKMLARKDTVVKQNNDGILYLFKKNKVSFFHGRGSFVKAGTAATRSPVGRQRRR
jgi:dihydrolipoamide dehydrogenase